MTQKLQRQQKGNHCSGMQQNSIDTPRPRPSKPAPVPYKEKFAETDKELSSWSLYCITGRRNLGKGIIWRSGIKKKSPLNLQVVPLRCRIAERTLGDKLWWVVVVIVQMYESCDQYSVSKWLTQIEFWQLNNSRWRFSSRGLNLSCTTWLLNSYGVANLKHY